jgi:hypothetical protein
LKGLLKGCLSKREGGMGRRVKKFVWEIEDKRRKTSRKVVRGVQTGGGI